MWAKRQTQNLDGSAATTTKHSDNCKRVFSYYDLNCPRCQELSQDASARKGWNDLAKRNEAQRILDIREHFAPGGKHSRGECGPVCTAFDW